MTAPAAPAALRRAFVVPVDHPALPGHFPGRPIVPGVWLLETVLELVEAVHGAAVLTGLPQVKFVQPLLPGETAEVLLDAAGMPAAAPSDPAATQGPPRRVRFRVVRGEATLASGELEFSA